MTTEGAGLVKVLWDIENVHCNNPVALKRALVSYLTKHNLYRVFDRMEITAYHDPRRAGALSEDVVDTLAIVPINLIDKGSKKGLADHCIARDCRNISYDVAKLGLRVRAVVVISSDSDYSAAGVYDALNDVGIPLVVVHMSNVKRSLLDTASDMRRFIHLEDLLAWLPVLPPPSRFPIMAPLGGAGDALGRIPDDTMTGTPSLERRASTETYSEAPPPPAEENMEMFRAAVFSAIQQAGGKILGSKLGTSLRSVFNFKQLVPLLEAMDGIKVVRPQGGPGDITVSIIGESDAGSDNEPDIILPVAEDHLEEFGRAVRRLLSEQGPMLNSKLGIALRELFAYTTKLSTLLKSVDGIEEVPPIGMNTFPMYQLANVRPTRG
jgi:hypothetical protein